MGTLGYMQGSEHSDRQGFGEVAQTLVKRNTEELEIASTHALSCSLCRQMKALRKISLLSLNFSEVKSERKRVALQKKMWREKNEGKKAS